MEHREGCGEGAGGWAEPRIPLGGCGSKELHAGLRNQALLPGTWHGTARHGTLSSQMHTPRSQPSAAGGAGRWLQALPEPSPTRRCDKHPMEPAANPVKSPGAGMELGGDPACCFPTPILSPGAGGTEPGGHRGGWAPSLSVPLTPRAPCSHLPGAATPDGCRMLGRRDFPDVN